MQLSVKEASFAVLGSAIMRENVVAGTNEKIDINDILSSSTGDSPPFAIIQKMMLEKGREAINEYIDIRNTSSKLYTKAITTIHSAAMISRLHHQAAIDNTFAKDQIRDEITKSFHAIEQMDSSKNVSDRFEKLLRKEITTVFPVEQAEFATALIDEAEENYVNQVQYAVLAKYNITPDKEINNELEM
ncbi:hypothetical protein V5E43_000712 [Yersinia enterocolitica]|uniref:hypothetical protein n=1 Tax=Yersinia TaxID=629 RepID=UPI0005E7E282|nr:MULTISPECIES: hypothetical protein [Yersinia]MCW6576410.1 hypothetical protein [Yersinia ruckeri]CQH78929.1 Uncharacterised protein [Yersinia enterocolitica]